jgi:hypothetical protein
MMRRVIGRDIKVIFPPPW